MHNLTIDDLNPRMSRSEARETINHRLNNMLNANRSQHLIELLLRKQDYRCALCGNPLGPPPRSTINVHHRSYEWLCAYATNDDEPPCEKCREQHADDFAQCVSGCRLVILHPGCHYLVHKNDPHVVEAKQKSPARQKANQERAADKNKMIEALLPTLEELADNATSVEHFIELCESRDIRITKRKRTDNLSFGVMNPRTGRRMRISTQHKLLVRFNAYNLAIEIENRRRTH